MKLIEPAELSEDMVDKMHNEVLETLKRHVEVLSVAHARLKDIYDIVGQGSLKCRGKYRSDYVRMAIDELNNTLGRLDFGKLAHANALMVVVDIACENWQQESNAVATAIAMTTDNLPKGGANHGA